MLQSMGSQRVRHDLATEKQQAKSHREKVLLKRWDSLRPYHPECARSRLKRWDMG